MAQYHLLASESRSLSLKSIFRLTEDKAFHLLKAHCWGNPDDVADVVFHIVVFVITPIFSNLVNVGAANIANAISILRPIPLLLFINSLFVDILAAILLFANEVKGISAITMIRHLNINYKTAFVLCHKLRVTKIGRGLTSRYANLLSVRITINSNKKPIYKAENFPNLDQPNVA